MNDLEVVVAGGGNAALCAAITAREKGASVTLFESAPSNMRGGNTRHTRNLRASHVGPLETLEESYSEDEFWDDILKVTRGNTDEKLTHLMIKQSSSLMSWLKERDVHFQPALSGTLSLHRTNAFFLGGGKTLLNKLYSHAEKIGVKVRYDSEITSVSISNNRAHSIDVKTATDTTTYGIKHLIAASGGFQSNEEWMREAWGKKADNFLIRGTPYNRGTLLKALMNAGAKTVGDPTQCHAVAIDARAPKYDGGIVSRLDSVSFGIVVNQEGHRFYDEGEDFWPKRYAIWGRLVAQQPGQIAYSIVDNKVKDRFMPSIFPPIKGSSLEDLAAKLKIDPPILRATVEQFNRAVQHGDYDSSKLDGKQTLGLSPDKTNWALTLDSLPFLAYPLKPGITFTYLGLKINERAEVLNRDDTPFGNVTAAGEIMAGNILGEGYCAGTGMTIGGVFGRIAGNVSP
ncbi:MAG: FAD-dependent tricarballylate dehydrogenase TcuA [Candidatus Azotimanducaceae bacterium]